MCVGGKALLRNGRGKGRSEGVMGRSSVARGRPRRALRRLWLAQNTRNRARLSVSLWHGVRAVCGLRPCFAFETKGWVLPIIRAGHLLNVPPPNLSKTTSPHSSQSVADLSTSEKDGPCLKMSFSSIYGPLLPLRIVSTPVYSSPPRRLFFLGCKKNVLRRAWPRAWERRRPEEGGRKEHEVSY